MALLGDWHGPSGDIENSLIDQPSRKLWYAGSHEAQNISQTWQGRVLAIDIELGREAIVNPMPVGSLRFIHIEFEFEEDMEGPLELLNDRLGEIDDDHDLTFVRLNLTGEATPETLEALDENLADFIDSWPFNIVERRDLSVLINQENTDSNLRQIERELENMNLDPGVLARSIVLLRRYHRRLA